MKKTIVLIMLLVGFSAFSHIEKDSINFFTFQRLALLEDCDACGCAASGGSSAGYRN